jgi:hypothetical protein
MADCFACGNKIGAFSAKFYDFHLEKKGVMVPDDMGKDDVICQSCFDAPETAAEKQRESELKSIKEQAKTFAKKTFEDIQSRVPETKAKWDKTGVIEYKDEYVAVLHRMLGMQVEFLIAYSDLTKEGYRLMAQDEGKTASMGGLSGGVDSRYYFQNMKYVS